MKLENQVAIIFGAGQMPGRTVGNGKAAALLYAREGAKVFCVDANEEAAQLTATDIEAEGGTALPFRADVTSEADIIAAVQACMAAWGRIDILHNNVGISIAGGDAPITEIEVDAFDRIFAVNLRSMVLTCKHILPIMREQRSGKIINISSAAAINNYPYVAYKTSKAAVVALTDHVAARNAEYNIRANVLLPGMVNTPMAVENRISKFNMSYEEVLEMRNQDVPLNHKMGTAWDIANAALWLASDDSAFVTGVAIPVDGGLSVQRGRAPSKAEAAQDADAAAKASAKVRASAS